MAQKIKRFYEDVAVQLVDDDGAKSYQITLDGRALKTPQRHSLNFNSEAVANLVADEWRAQEEFIDTDVMPLMRVYSIAIDRVPIDRALMLEDMLGYLPTDMLCYRAPAETALSERQAQHFDPVLQAFQKRFGVILRMTDGVMPVDQPEAAQDAVRDVLEKLPPASLAAMALIVPLLGSLVLALAMLHDEINADEAFACARLDETVAAERYGADPTLEASLAGKLRDVLAVGQLFKQRNEGSV